MDNTDFSLFGAQISATYGVSALLWRFLMNFLVTGIIIRLFYYSKSKRRDYFFTFVLISLTVFLLIYLLDSVKLQIGMALGLFAIFGIIRYRTESIPIREMTYLFVVIGISVINGLSNTDNFDVLVVTNILFILVIWLMESSRFLKHTSCKLVTYDKIELIKPEKEKELLADLEERTGLKIQKVEVGHIDFLKDIAFVKIYYSPLYQEENTIDEIRKAKEFSE